METRQANKPLKLAGLIHKLCSSGDNIQLNCYHSAGKFPRFLKIFQIFAAPCCRTVSILYTASITGQEASAYNALLNILCFRQAFLSRHKGCFLFFQ